MTTLLSIRDLHVRFEGRDRTVHAVNGINFDLAAGEVLGILGESGSGKSVTLRAILGLLPPRRTRYQGQILFEGKELLGLPDAAFSRLRGKSISMIFQEPATSFDPVYTVGRQIAETIIRHEGVGEAAAMARAKELLELVRIPSAAERLRAYPHEMSGGMRQRAMIALALACRPKLLLADEPTTALDATVQIQVLLLLAQLQKDLGLGVIFVTHDVGVAVEVSSRLAVMYAGRVVETGPLADIVRRPVHPYTQGLLASTVHGSMRGRRLDAIPGAPPALATAPVGCSFAPRCRHAQAECDQPPPEHRFGSGRMARCVLAAERAAA
ncbi:peptide/nickel transport system ATP-binding protein [Stella humosa]|uniref:Peptide/nickel transport system ATP-binding protein n=1 Tax=Stella humosa TaxID=94 RepID=A0A3N1M2H0_9PROT|nr:ABC transporter ATP-binding protein [Stella humosa]ROP99921.1 peptide/nickel transport system ATP-binding protein [Stella humosa]BBK30849.1 ABC transporter ATP-binding protein [Stella humosa]